MDNIGLIFAGVELLGKRKKWLGIVREKSDIKNISGAGQIVLLQIVVQSSSWSSVYDKNDLKLMEFSKRIHI